MSVTGIKKIKSTEPGQIVAHLDNSVVYISGTNLSVQNVSIQTGVLEITGIVSAIRYTAHARGRFKLSNLFK